MKYEDGIWQQSMEDGFLRWSRHQTEARAIEAARAYARHQRTYRQGAGGALSWAGGWRQCGERSVNWVNAYRQKRWEYEWMDK